MSTISISLPLLQVAVHTDMARPPSGETKTLRKQWSPARNRIYTALYHMQGLKKGVQGPQKKMSQASNKGVVGTDMQQSQLCLSSSLLSPPCVQRGVIRTASSPPVRNPVHKRVAAKTVNSPMKCERWNVLRESIKWMLHRYQKSPRRMGWPWASLLFIWEKCVV